MENLSGIQSFDVMPCCSGPAPMIMDAQLGLLEVGITPRAWYVQAPRARSLSMFGTRALRRPSGLRPS
ncbi:MAG TPA: hypothetical protein DEH78_21520 [Solibacterales bacterium]|nr:hypothetical protein [Bryobacterales bacterium]